MSVALIPGPSPKVRREIMESLAATFTLTFMVPEAAPNDENGEAFTLITGKAAN